MCIQGNFLLLSNCFGIHCFTITDRQQFLALHVCDCMCVVSKEIKENSYYEMDTNIFQFAENQIIILLIDRTLHSPQLNE